VRLATYRHGSGSRLCVVKEGRIAPAAPWLRAVGLPEDLPSVQALLESGEGALAALLKAPVPASAAWSEIDASTLLPPIPRPQKIIAIGLNYRDHAAEQGVEVPAAPLLFAKFPSSIAAPFASIVIPREDPQVDYEAELAVVIGRRGRRISEPEALAYVAGYMSLNDVSARAWQFADKQWTRGKSCDTFCPCGPWLTTREEIADPGALRISATLNGQTVQESTTANLVFGVAELVAYISASITLEPGDIIATGTPPGVGVFRRPPVFLKPGDVIEVEVEGLGAICSRVVLEH